MMDYLSAIQREDAMEWLLRNCGSFPAIIPPCGPCSEMSGRRFEGWRWVLADDDQIIFANGIVPCITSLEFEVRKAHWNLSCGVGQ